jgi:biotin carboxyl carrier protein
MIFLNVIHVVKNFRVNVNQNQNFELNTGKLKDLDLVSNGELKYHILNKNKSFQVEILHTDFNKKEYTISLNSKTYCLKISDDLDLMIKKMGYSFNGAKKLNAIHAPMPGIIIDLEVKQGDEVKEGDSILILEAMKMENSIKCPKDGIVKSVHTQKGDAVEKGKLLIELE